MPPPPPSLAASSLPPAPGLAEPRAAAPGQLAEWFTAEVHPHDRQLKAYLRQAYPKIHDVEDVVQETYLRLWRRHALRPIASVKNFLFSVARHLAVDQVRRAQASPIAPVANLAELSVEDAAPGVAEVACSKEEVALLLAAIDALPRRCREIMILRKLQGWPQKEIARHLGLSEQTVQVQIGRGMRRCEAHLRRYGAGQEGAP